MIDCSGSTQPDTRERGSKRKREANLEDASENEGSTYSGHNIRGRKRSRPGTDDVTRSFGCPFFKRDPIHHAKCISFNLRRIPDVKQHLQRKHYQTSMYCPVCQREFSDAEQRDDHIRQRKCTEHPPCRMDPSTGLIPLDKQEILRGRIRGSEEDIWYQIWAVLFDGAPPPATPYQTTMMEEAAGVLQGFWKQHHSAIISDILDGPTRDANLDLIRSQLPGLVSTALVKLTGRLKTAIHNGSYSGPTSPGSGASSISASSTEENIITPLTPLQPPFQCLNETYTSLVSVPSPATQLLLDDSFVFEGLLDSECFDFQCLDTLDTHLGDGSTA